MSEPKLWFMWAAKGFNSF